MSNYFASPWSGEDRAEVSPDICGTWGQLVRDHHLPEIDGSDFLTMMQEVDVLLQKGVPLGLALMVGGTDQSLLQEAGRTAKGLADQVSWVALGPMALALFRRGVPEQLRPLWRRVVAGGSDIACGVAYSQGMKNHQELLLAARIALRRAIGGHAGYVLLEPEEAAKAIADHRMAVAMKNDLDAGGRNFEAHFQPQIDMQSGVPAGADALARWNADGKSVPPSVFIPIAEEAGLVGEIGRMMFARSARAIRSMRRQGLPIPHISVNLSPIQSHQGDLVRTALDIVRSERVAPSDIEIEVTDSSSDGGGDDFPRCLGDLSAAGFPISIDDFGTATSTLARIREMPASTVRLGRDIVAALPHDPAARAISRGALDLCRALGKSSIAKGIERPEQASCLASMGCLLGQGFLWARPMPEQELGSWWQGWTAPGPGCTRFSCPQDETPSAGRSRSTSRLCPDSRNAQ